MRVLILILLLIAACNSFAKEVNDNGWYYMPSKVGASYTYTVGSLNKYNNEYSSFKAISFFVNCKTEKTKCIRVIMLNKENGNAVSYRAAKYIPENKNIYLKYDNANFELKNYMSGNVLPIKIIFDKEQMEEAMLQKGVKMTTRTKYIHVPSVKVANTTYKDCVEAISNSSFSNGDVKKTTSKYFYCKDVGKVKFIGEASSTKEGEVRAEAKLISISYPLKN